MADVRGLMGAALVETALVTWRDVAREKIPPPPSDYVAVAIIYGLLGLLPESGQGFANVVGWGFVVATLLNFWSPSNPMAIGAAKQAPAQPAGGAPSG